MNCTDARAALPLLVYDDPDAVHDAALREHLAGCAACRRERQELERLRPLLDAAQAPPVAVDVAKIRGEVAGRQARRLRRWRRVALAVSALAAGLLLVVGLRLEVRLSAGQLVLRWGEPPPAAPATVPPQPLTRKAVLSPETEAELRVLSELIHALKHDADARDRDITDRLDRLQRHVRALQMQGDERWSSMEQDVAALYVLTRKGENP